jgi:hypothetical protein
MLTPGEHVIVSAYFSSDVAQWRPIGVFTIHDGRVIQLDSDQYVQIGNYESVAEFARALASPPPTPHR